MPAKTASRLIIALAALILNLAIIIHQPLRSLSLSAQQEATPTAQDQATDSAATSIKKRLQEVLQKQPPSSDFITAWFGKIEDIANSTLTVNTLHGSKLASLTKEAKIIRSPGSKTIAAEDLAIGDFAIAMGRINDNQVLETRRLVVTSQSTTPKPRLAFLATILDIDQSSLILAKLSDQNEIDFSISKKTKFTQRVANNITPATVADFKPTATVLVIAELTPTTSTSASQTFSTLLHLHLL